MIKIEINMNDDHVDVIVSSIKILNALVLFIYATRDHVYVIKLKNITKK